MTDRPDRPAPSDPARFADPGSPIVVVGGSLAGMAVAARLAYRGHHVVLLERDSGLGGSWARTGLPPVLELPAVWRDLFTKSGRALDAVLTTRGLSWTAVPTTRHRFADDTELDWPTNRGEQARVIADTWGEAPARRWGDLLDQLGDSWQLLRGLGLDTDTTPAAWRAAAPRLVPRGFRPRATVADLAAGLGHEHLARLVTQPAWQRGQDPNRLPAHHAVWLTVARTFGRWTLTDAAGAVAPYDTLITLLTERLGQRRVEVRTETLVEHVAGHTVTTTSGVLTARAVIGAVPAHQWGALTRPGRLRSADRARRRTAALPWAIHPAITPTTPTTPTPAAATEPDEDPLETVDHAARRITWSDTSWDWATGRPDPAAGPAWASTDTWHALPGPRVAPHYAVGAHTRAGSGPLGELFSAALAAYAVHADLTGEDIHPTNRNQPPRLRRR